MMAEKTVLALDLDAGSGPVIAVQFDGRAIRLEVLHRFPNTTIILNGTKQWNLLWLRDEK